MKTTARTIAVSLMAALSGSAYAATIPVSTTADSGAGSLRAALASAADGDTIDATGVAGAIVLTGGELLVSNSVTILGPGAANLIVDGNTASRVFHISNAVVVTISSLTISNGLASGGPGGGIFNDNSTLTVSNCVVAGNSAFRGGGIANIGEGPGSAALSIANCTLGANAASHAGGAIFNEGLNFGTATVVIVDSTLEENAAASHGGAIFSTTNGGLFGPPAGVVALQLVNCSVSSNSADFGGGISSVAILGGTATFDLLNSTVNGNRATSSGGGLSLGDSFLGRAATATNTITGTTIHENFAADGGGGGLAHFHSVLVIASSSILSNAVSGSGGGIWHAGTATLLISNSTVSANAASSQGGGLFVGDIGERFLRGDPAVEIFASTFSENTAFEGAGIASRTDRSETMSVDIDNSTLSSNIASFGGAILNFGRSSGLTAIRLARTTFSGNSASIGGGILNTTELGGTATVVIVNTILNAGALGNNIDNVAVGSATVTSLGYNLSSDGAGGLLTATGDQINKDPKLGPLQDNGGPTFTHALLAGSPAIDAGDPGFSPPPHFDQRGPGFSRVINGRIDVGAYETQTAVPPLIMTCGVTVLTNGVVVTTNTCGSGATAGVVTGELVTAQIEVCADPANSDTISDLHAELTVDGSSFASASGPVSLLPGDCLIFATFASSDFCTNDAVRTFVATVTSSTAEPTACTNTVECCAVSPPNRCPLTAGYWKNHPAAWPVSSLSLGCQTYTQAELLTILSTPTGKGSKADASLILAAQLIAAKLNIANGSDPTPVASAIAQADSLLCAFPGKLPYKIRSNSSTGKAMISVAGILNSYNNALLTPDCTR